jgi:acetyl esterase/lipase
VRIPRFRPALSLVCAAVALVTVAGCGSNPIERPAKQVTVLFMHGGAWAGGSPAELEPLAAQYRSLGYNAVSIEYRDGNNDIVHLIDNVQAQVSKYRSNGPVVLYGVSAGGTLAAALAAAGKVDGAVVIGGPTDLPAWSSNPYRAFLARQVLDALGMKRDEFREASPIRRLSDRPAPQLLQYGDRDQFVPFEQGATYARAARKRQPDIKLETLKGVDHSRLGTTPASVAHALEWIRRRWPPPA